MKQTSRTKVASLITALFLGGLAAAGLATRPDGGATDQVASAKPKVIHKRKVKTVRAPSAPVAAAPATASAPIPVSSPAPVSSSVSPAGSTGNGDEDEHEGGGEERE
ncbi:MAG: hypothetical protein ACXWZ3_08030 [Solirubrobacterales bacterium]